MSLLQKKEPSTNILNHKKDDLVIYPNPTSGLLFINIEEQQNRVKGELINLLGDVVATYPNLHSGINNISIDELSNGIYMMKLYFDNKIVVSRIVKK